ncbi:MAG: hypothetical protein ACP5QG_07905 [candidate division WOR-3 bacterium]
MKKDRREIELFEKEAKLVWFGQDKTILDRLDRYNFPFQTAERWVESVNRLGRGTWDYIKVIQGFWERHRFNTFAELLETIKETR